MSAAKLRKPRGCACMGGGVGYGPFISWDLTLRYEAGVWNNVTLPQSKCTPGLGSLQPTGAWSFPFFVPKQPCLVLHGKFQFSFLPTWGHPPRPGPFPSVFTALVGRAAQGPQGLRGVEFGPEKAAETEFSCFLFSRRVFLGFLHASFSCGYSRVGRKG